MNQRLVFTHNWELPWLRGSSNRFVRTVVAGLGFSGITSFRTGFPSPSTPGVRRGLNPLTVLGGGGQVRPNASGPVNIEWKPAGSAGAPFGTASPDGVQAVSAYATSLGLSQPLLGNFGGMGRNVLRLNGETNFDWNVYKNFNITESVRFQFRAELYNVFNNTSFQDVSRVITAPTSGSTPRLARTRASFSWAPASSALRNARSPKALSPPEAGPFLPACADSPRPPRTAACYLERFSSTPATTLFHSQRPGMSGHSKWRTD